MILLEACMSLQYIYIVRKEEKEWGTKEMKEKDFLWGVNSVVSETGTDIFRNLLPPFLGSPLSYLEYGDIGFL
jgi:hypothetical protein